MSTAVVTNSLQAWVKASRPKTLGAICCPILIGSACAMAHGTFARIYFVVTLVCSISLQILANVVNDYGDFLKGSDSHERLGPPRAMQMGWITPSAMRKGIAVISMSTIVLGLVLVNRGGMPIFLTGCISLFLCMWYTLGPLPLAYLGFSELMILVVFGPLAALGAYYVQTLSFSLEVLVASTSPGLLATALILTNNLRDIREDQKNHKRTIAVRFGEKFARIAIVSLVISALMGPIILVSAFGYSPILLVACLALGLPARHFLMILREPISARFNLMLASIGISLYLFGMLMSLGLVYGAP